MQQPIKLLRSDAKEGPIEGNARVVHQAVHPPLEGNGPIGQGQDLIYRVEIGLGQLRISPQGSDLGEGRHSAVLAVGVVHDYVGALASEFDGNFPPDPRAGARDQGYHSRKPLMV